MVLTNSLDIDSVFCTCEMKNNRMIPGNFPFRSGPAFISLIDARHLPPFRSRAFFIG